MKEITLTLAYPSPQQITILLPLMKTYLRNLAIKNRNKRRSYFEKQSRKLNRPNLYQDGLTHLPSVNLHAGLTTCIPTLHRADQPSAHAMLAETTTATLLELAKLVADMSLPTR